MPPMLFYLKEIRHNVKVNYGNPDSRDSMLDPDLRSSPTWSRHFYSQLTPQTVGKTIESRIVWTPVKSTNKVISVRSHRITALRFRFDGPRYIRPKDSFNLL